MHRGFRVRIGMHSGIVSANDISINRAAGRTQYKGSCLKRARQVGDAAHGGMVLCSGDTFGMLPLNKFENKSLILYSGEHTCRCDALWVCSTQARTAQARGASAGSGQMPEANYLFMAVISFTVLKV